MSINRFLELNFSYRSYFETKMARFKITQSLARGETVSLQNEMNNIYYIHQGLVRQSFLDDDGKLKTVLILGSNDFFGEVSFIQSDYDQVITETLQPTEIVEISFEQFESFLDDVLFCQNLLLHETTKMRILMAQIYDQTYYPVRQRLLYLLIRLGLQRGEYQGDLIHLNFYLNHEDIAQMINSTRATVTKEINQLLEEEMVLYKNRNYFIPKSTIDRIR